MANLTNPMLVIGDRMLGLYSEIDSDIWGKVIFMTRDPVWDVTGGIREMVTWRVDKLGAP